MVQRFLNTITYHSSMSDSTEQENFEYMLTHKKCVLHFVQEWARIVGGAFKEDHTINAFLEVNRTSLLLLLIYKKCEHFVQELARIVGGAFCA